MSLSKMENAVSIDFLKGIANTTFVQKFMTMTQAQREQLEDLDSLSTEQAQALTKQLFAIRYKSVHDIAIALNEMIDRSNNELPVTLTQEVEWQGFINATEEPIKCLLSEGTVLNLLEFVESPKDGFIFQLTLGEGGKGKHFNIPMDEALEKSDELVEIIQTARNIRTEDLLNGIDF